MTRYDENETHRNVPPAGSAHPGGDGPRGGRDLGETTAEGVSKAGEESLASGVSGSGGASVGGPGAGGVSGAASSDWLETELRALADAPRARAPEAFTAKVMDRLEVEVERGAWVGSVGAGAWGLERERAGWLDALLGQAAGWAGMAVSPSMAAAVLGPLVLLTALNLSVLGTVLQAPVSHEDSTRTGVQTESVWEDPATDESQVWISIPFPDPFSDDVEG